MKDNEISMTLDYDDYTVAIRECKFHGTAGYARVANTNTLLSDGLTWLVFNFDMPWIISPINKVMETLKNTYFMIAEITVEKRVGTIHIQDGNYIDLAEIIVQDIGTPEGKYVVWIANGPQDKVLYLNTEH